MFEGMGWGVGGWGLGAGLHVTCSEMTINAVLSSEGQLRLQICAVLLLVTSTMQFHLFVFQV